MEGPASCLPLHETLHLANHSAVFRPVLVTAPAAKLPDLRLKALSSLSVSFGLMEGSTGCQGH